MAGVVCVNSTAGLAAIEFGTPTITLGRAIYDMPGLTHQGDLDGFWTAPQVPDAELYLAFRHVVIAETQINGAYATAKGRHLAVPEIARRLLAPESI
jgi:capsular polysaccharide export protein